MVKINFQEFAMPTGISGTETQAVDVRENFADVIYNNLNGIRAHELAHKIYKTEGEADYDDLEIEMITNVANAHCTPRFIDGLNGYLEAAKL